MPITACLLLRSRELPWYQLFTLEMYPSNRKTLKPYGALVGIVLHMGLCWVYYLSCGAVLWRRSLLSTHAMASDYLFYAQKKRIPWTAVLKFCTAGEMHPLCQERSPRHTNLNLCCFTDSLCEHSRFIEFTLPGEEVPRVEKTRNFWNNSVNSSVATKAKCSIDKGVAQHQYTAH